ncbi:response regulator [Methylophaga sp.]|uniref:MerR family transcriptional regulator n=1 Tax=Methylophaga sp. TaxID=2024840 RepID=UPI003F6A11DD
MTTINDFRDNYTTSQVAKLMGVSTKTVQTWCDEGILHFTKTNGGHRRIPTADLKALIRRKKQHSEEGREVTTDHHLILPESSPRDEVRVLIVDDDTNILTLYKAQIESWDLKVDVTCSSDPFEALLLMGRRRFDLLITDILMPGIDGAQMLQKIRSKLDPDMQVLVVSSLRADEVANQYILPDKVDIFEKPISFVALRDSISKLVEKKAI